MAGLVAVLDPESVPLPEATGVWEQLDRIERLAHNGKVAMVRRVQASHGWQAEGYRSVTDYLAAKAGTSPGEAHKSVETSRKLRQAPPVVQDAAASGKLSGAQLEMITDAAAVNPDAAGALVEQAKTATFRELRNASGRAQAAADKDRDATEKRIRRRRHFRSWTEADGTWRAALAGTVADGARIEKILEPVTDRLFRHNGKLGIREGRDAYKFDALMQTLEDNSGVATSSADDGAGPADADGAPTAQPDGSSKVTWRTDIRVDVEALWRGHTEGDELCEIVGLGPIPVRRARELLGESVLRIVFTRGQDVTTIAPAGRGWTAAQRLAATWNSPGCTVIGCTCPYVELDHRHEYAEGGPTIIANADPLCPEHHDLKTHKHWGLEPGVGKRHLVPPDDPRHPRNQPAPSERLPLHDTG